MSLVVDEEQELENLSGTRDSTSENTTRPCNCPYCDVVSGQRHKKDCAFLRCPYCHVDDASDCCGTGGPIVTTWAGIRVERLYHGTSEEHLDSILKNGLQPRGDRHSNWEGQPSRTDCVYLTTNQGFGAARSTSNSSRIVVFEIPLIFIPFDEFLPDEDFIADYRAGNEAGSATYHDLIGPVRDELEDYRHHWGDSLCLMGTVAHQGEILPSNISRYCVVDCSKRPALPGGRLKSSMFEFQLNREKDDINTAWFFGDEPELHQAVVMRECVKDGFDFAPQLECWQKKSQDRSGIEVVDVNPDLLQGWSYLYD